MNSTEQLRQHLKDDRTFFHDLATPLMIALGMAEKAQRLNKDAALTADLENLMRQLKKIRDLAEKRRDLIHKEEKALT